MNTDERGCLANRWSDAARAASIAVRKAKAAARKAAAGPGVGISAAVQAQRAAAQAQLERESEAEAQEWADKAAAAFRRKYGRGPKTDSEIARAEALAQVPEKFRTYGGPASAEAAAEAQRAKAEARGPQGRMSVKAKKGPFG
jgi:hypothetical protein